MLFIMSRRYIMIHLSIHIFTTFLVPSRRPLTWLFSRHSFTTLLSLSRHYFTLHFQDALSRRLKYQKRRDKVSWGSVVKKRQNPQDTFGYFKTHYHDAVSWSCVVKQRRDSVSWDQKRREETKSVVTGFFTCDAVNITIRSCMMLRNWVVMCVQIFSRCGRWS